MKVPPGIIIDAEANGLHPDKFYCLVTKDKDGEVPYTEYDDFRSFFVNTPLIVGQNIRRWDLVHLQRVVGVDYSKCRIIDTLSLSWYLFPQRQKHGLEAWGEEFGVPKPPIEDWHNRPIEDYIHRCTEDVKINWKLWELQWNKLLKIYENDEDKIWEFLDYLDFKMYCAMKQEESKWKLDVELATETIRKLEHDREQRTKELEAAMPKVPIVSVRSYPAKPFRKDGSLSETGKRWFDLLDSRGLDKQSREDIRVVTGTEQPNAGSHQQIKDWLYSLGWKPQTFKYKKEDDGSQREIPQINLEHGKGLCESIKRLIPSNPELNALDGLSVISHRLGLVRGFIDSVDDEGFVKAEIQGLTNTLRFKHAVVVNLPKVGKPWGEEIRGCLTAREGQILVGSDMASLEDRLKQHFLYRYDPEYVKKLMVPDYDPHIDLAIMGKMLTPEQGEAYKNGDKQYKPVRDIAKNGNYSCQYGAGPPKIALTAGISLSQAKIVHKAYWDLNWSIKAVAKDQHWKELDGEKWLLNPINGFWYSLREIKDIFSTLVQGTASYVFDMWIGYVLQEYDQLTGQFHDEGVWEIEDAEDVKEGMRLILREAIQAANDNLQLDRELDIDIQFNKRYSGIH